MENNIVTGFQNLRVFSSRNILKMDELVQDLSNALEETSKNQKSQPSEGVVYHPTSRRCHRKRRGKKRRPNVNPLWRHAAISEASESSVDEALLNHLNMNQHSDSDEFTVGYNLHQFSMPISDPIPPVESDSVTENFSPIRPNRRRRKFKSMAVDPVPTITASHSQPCLDSKAHIAMGYPRLRQTMLHSRSSLAILESVPPMATLAAPSESIIPGKRKRSSKSRSDNAYDRQDMDDCMEVSGCYQESASSISSSESDGSITNDEAREGDDEQSDFFQEPGTTCGVPGLPPWWEETHTMEEGGEVEGELVRRPYTPLCPLPHVPQRAAPSRFNRVLAGGGREIRFGRRNLNGKIPNYTMNSYLQDQQKWSVMQGNAWLSCPTGHASDFKRRRKTPPSSPLNEGFTGEGPGANLDGSAFSS